MTRIFKSDLLMKIKEEVNEDIAELLTSTKKSSVIYIKRDGKIVLGAFNYGPNYYSGLAQIETVPPSIVANLDSKVLGIRKGEILQSEGGIDYELDKLDTSKNTEHYFYDGSPDDILMAVISKGYEKVFLPKHI